MDHLSFFTLDAFGQEFVLQIIIKFIFGLLKIVYTIIIDSPFVQDFISTVISWLESLLHKLNQLLIRFYCIYLICNIQNTLIPSGCQKIRVRGRLII